MSEPIPACTIWQPWTSLIIVGAKPYEFRSRRPPTAWIGKRIAIHAGARPMKLTEVRSLMMTLTISQCAERPRRETGLIKDLAMPVLERARAYLEAARHDLPTGLWLSSVLGTAVLGEPTQNPVVNGRHLVEDSDRTDKMNWAWPLTDIIQFDVPVPARGKQGAWYWAPP